MSSSVGQRGRARGGARTMPCWLWAAMLLASAGVGVGAWRPPAQPVVLTPRSRRHANHDTRHLHLLGWRLELHENKAITSPFYNKCLFYKGRVLHEPGSTATVTECGDQLYGLLQVGGEEFVLQPTQTEGAHVLRRRDVMLAEHPFAYNLTDDTVTDLDLDFEEDYDLLPMPHVRPRNTDHPETDYFNNNVQVVTRPVSGVKGLWLEMAIVADHTMLKFHGRERVKHYILALMNIVSAIFNDPSLNSNITLVINKLFLIEEKDSIIKHGNVKKSLEGVNKWNYRHLNKLPAGSAGWDATIWLTRAHLGGPSGFAPVGGVCTKLRSAAIDRDEGLTSAFVIAHELAHLLGLTHDGEDQCQTAALRGSVMAPIVLATLHNFAWSSCSKQQFHEKAKKWWCLHERSHDKGVELGGAKEISHYVFTMDEQCRTEFGEGFSVCKSVKVRSACSRLWCAHKAMPHVCRSKRAPPLEGTPCGHNQWCVDRICEPMPGHGVESKVEVGDSDKPEWGEWGAWSDCSADCGYGLRTRIRRCRYRGSVSESACEGAGSQVSTCWAGAACAASRDIRADYCHRLQHRLIPHVHPNDTKHCEIWCVDYEGGEASGFGALPDGTSCSYQRPFDVCFQGTCVKGQCNATDPACNWCPDGYCNNNTLEYNRQLGNGWTRMTMVPHEANQLSVHITTPIALQIAIRERKRDKPILELSKHSKRIDIDNKQNNYLKYDPNVPQNLQIIEVDSHVIDIKEGGFQWEGEAVAAGTLLKWKQTDTDVFITSNSRLQTDLMIMATPAHPSLFDDPVSVTVAVKYSTPAGRSRPLEYRWSAERGPCSASCGGGLRIVQASCPRDQKCPPPRYEPCNTHSCEFIWSAGEWEECSATCGDNGVQERQLYCIPANVSTTSTRELIKNSASPALCPSTKPDRQQECNRRHCPVYWREMAWTQCSTTCGRGISRRPLVCPAADESLCGPKPRERRRHCRQRRCPPSPSPRPLTACPATDAAQYCELFTHDQLVRNCVVPPFRKYCCNACREADRTRKFAMMRRGSMAIVGGGEPLIVVEESGAEDAESSPRSSAPARGLSIDQESPPDPYHLSPWRDNRKHSLPTPSCTSGPTASQVRRLSERGEGAAREAREAAFLATLSQAPPQPGGRRHSVVTISRVPQALFGRGRRESIAAFPALGRRRDSGSTKCPPATDTLGSTHNLQLDIMDDIVQARKVRMRLWNTSNERVCEVQPLDERSPMGGSVRYTNRGRRHSDFVGSPLPPIPARRRASEMPPPPPIPPRSGAGVVCTDTDLQHMLNALTSSATEIDRCGKPERTPRRLADMRSSSFDASSLRGDKPTDTGTTWFTRRHQTLATKKKESEPKKGKVTFAADSKQAPGDIAKVVWDKPTGSVVDASALGSAIEVFLRKSSAAEPGPSTSVTTTKETPPKNNEMASKPRDIPGPSRVSGRTEGERWYTKRPEEEEPTEGCDASLCSSLKDLFV